MKKVAQYDNAYNVLSNIETELKIVAYKNSVSIQSCNPLMNENKGQAVYVRC